MNIDFGRLTPEQTQDVAKRALQELDDDRIVEVIVDVVGGDDALADEISEQLSTDY